MRAPLTRDQFDAAELLVRREMAARVRTVEPVAKGNDKDRKDFRPEHLRLLDYFIERSLRLGRTAACFSTYRQLGRATQTFAHAHEALKWLVAQKVLAPLPLATKQLPAEERRNTAGCLHWYGFNLNFSDWPVKQKRPQEFWEEPALPFEPELEEMLRETFIEFSAGNLAVVATTETDRERDAVSAPVPHADKGAVGLNASPRPTSATDSKTESPPPQHKPQKWEEDLAAFKKALAENRLEEFSESSPECTPAGYATPSKSTKSVPPGGTATGKTVYPDPSCTPGGYSEKPNNDAAKAGDVPPGGTYPRAGALASLASTSKAKLAMPTVPPEGTRPPEKIAAAWRWLLTVDPEALRIKRFAEQWQVTCERYPDYVLNRLRGAFEDKQRRLKAGEPGVDPLGNALAWLAGKARQEGRMRWR